MATGPEDLVDGTLVHYSLGGLTGWAYIRGYEHPPGHIVVEPRRGSPEPPRRMLRCIGREAPLLQLSRAVAILSPWRAWNVWRDAMPLRFVEALESLPVMRLGLTGSTVLGLRENASDFDIIVVPENLEALYNELLRMKEKNIIEQCQYNRILAKRRRRQDIGVDPKHVASSLVESCLHGVPYTLRVLRAGRAVPCEPLHQSTVNLGRATLRLWLEPEEPWEAIAVPARYTAELLAPETGLPRRLVMESWRTRYAGLAPGVYIVSGELRLTSGGVAVISPDHGGGVWRV